jgi:hypothetical protein
VRLFGVEKVKERNRERELGEVSYLLQVCATGDVGLERHRLMSLPEEANQNDS